MRAAYYGGTALTGSGQSLGLLEYYGTNLADLSSYYSNAGQTNRVPITLLSTDGTSTSCVHSTAGGECDDTEQTLDMTQALGMAPGLASLVMYVGSSDAAIFNAMATAKPLNAQLSSSWTWSPADPGTDNPYFEEFAAQGQNLFQAAGDSGAWTSSSKIYPADDVYVTSVGGTDLQTSSADGVWSTESAWSDGGGGISPDEYAIPLWQTATANDCASCSQSYRNSPDVSANANFSFYVCADQATCTANSYGGTSFAAPMWAGYLALVNQQSVANGNQTVGFINPSLYAIGNGSNYDTDFHDITGGSNGYSATTGYDLATGWGSPNGGNLLNALAGAPAAAGFTLSASPGSVSVAQGSTGKLHHHQHGERRVRRGGRVVGFGNAHGCDGWFQPGLHRRDGRFNTYFHGCVLHRRRHLQHRGHGHLRQHDLDHDGFPDGDGNSSGILAERTAEVDQHCPGQLRQLYHHLDGHRRLQLCDFPVRFGGRQRFDGKLQPQLDHRRWNLYHEGYGGQERLDWKSHHHDHGQEREHDRDDEGYGGRAEIGRSGKGCMADPACSSAGSNRRERVGLRCGILAEIGSRFGRGSGELSWVPARLLALTLDSGMRYRMVFRLSCGCPPDGTLSPWIASAPRAGKHERFG